MPDIPRRILLPVVLVGVLAAGCGGGPPIAATVEGTPIPDAAVLELRRSYADGPTVDGETFREDLTRLVLLEAQKHFAAVDFDLELDDPAAVDAKLAAPNPDEQRLLDQVRAQPDFTEAMVRRLAEQLVVRERVAAAVLRDDAAFLEDVYTNRPELATRVCVRHILTATRPEAEAVLERLEAGEDFGAVADEVSLDTQSVGGVLPCPASAGRYVEPFGSTAATAPLGVVTGPIETEFGWHVLVVDERDAPGSLDELVADPLAYLDPTTVSERWVAWLDAAVRRADIEVRSDVGTWLPAADGIAPPPTG